MTTGSRQVAKLFVVALVFLLALSMCVSIIDEHPTATAGVALILILVIVLRIVWQRTAL